MLRELMKDGAEKARGLVISLVLISCGIASLIDHRGMNIQDIALFTNIGLVFLIGGTVCISLQLYVLRLSLRSKIT